MVFFFKTPKWASLSWDFCCIEFVTLCFFCSSLFCICDTLSCNSCQKLSNSMINIPIGYYLTFFLRFLWSKVKLALWLLAFLLTITLSFKWKMWAQFWYLHFKSFSIAWKTINMNQVYPLYFCPQGMGHPRNHMNASFSFTQCFRPFSCFNLFLVHFLFVLP
jgi:hypothetical protein